MYLKSILWYITYPALIALSYYIIIKAVEYFKKIEEKDLSN